MDAAADAFRDRATLIRDRTTLEQLASIEGSTLKAPEGGGSESHTTIGPWRTCWRWRRCAGGWRAAGPRRWGRRRT